MDGERFDRLIASLTRSGTRRGTLTALAGTLLGAVGIAGLTRDETEAARRSDRRRGQQRDAKRKHRNRTAAEAISASCCSSNACAPGPGQDLRKCCFDSADLSGANFRRANLSNAGFRGANLTNADFTGANLDKACFVDADITGAQFSGVNLKGVIFCRTKTGPNTFDNSGCGKATACCPTCIPLGEHRCSLGGSCCDNNAVCTSDTCVCRSGRTECDGKCVNTRTDSRNCGSCGNTCPSGETCRDGACHCGTGPTCTQGLTCCSGQCVNLLTDVNNCTACGNACPATLANASVACGEGLDENNNPGYGCTYVCSTGFENCDGDDLTGCERPISSDPNNCGGCGVTCPSTAPRCCGCKCFPADSNLCSICQEVTGARLIRKR